MRQAEVGGVIAPNDPYFIYFSKNAVSTDLSVDLWKINISKIRGNMNELVS